ncbi:MAG: bacteriohemerythrin [Holophagaceae bacterium]
MWFSKPKPAPEPEAPFLVWTREEHSVGVERFDQEHERLVARMNQVHTALLKKQDRSLALEHLESLIQETKAHFEHEEGVMRNVSYPDLEAHAAEHAALTQAATALLQKVQSGSLSALAIPEFLKAWLVPHLQTVDRKYAACLRRNGLH